MKIGSKLLVGTLLVALLGAAIAGIAYNSLSKVAQALHYQYEKATVPLVAGSHISSYHERARVAVRDLIAETNDDDIETKIEHINRILDSLSLASAEYQMNILESEEELFDELQTARSEHLGILLELYDVIREGETSVALAILREEEIPAAGIVGEYIEKLLERKVDYVAKNNEQITATIATENSIIGLLTISAFALAITIVILQKRTIV